MKKITQQGFTILEMLTVLAIFGVMTAIVVFNYGKFTSDTILTNMAYEVALSIREAQIYGVSVRNPNGALITSSFSVPYGVYAQRGTNQYFLFADETPAGNPNGEFDELNCTTSAECVTPYTLQRGVTIERVRKNCVEDTDGLNITFKRPNPEARFDNAINVASADITLLSGDGLERRYVVVRNNGQIYVTRDEPVCN